MSTVQRPATSAPASSPASAPPVRLVVAALVVGPLLVLVSALFNHTPATQAAVDVLTTVRAHREAHLTEVLLEMAGLAVTFAATATAALCIQGRGARLAVAGALCSVLGIVGFTMVNAEGLVVNALAGIPAQTAAETALDATNSSPAVYVAFPMIMLGELGLVAVLAAFRRAGRMPAWPAALALAAVAVDFTGGSQAYLVVSDVLVLVALWWLAAGLLRSGSARVGDVG